MNESTQKEAANKELTAQELFSIQTLLDPNTCKPLTGKHVLIPVTNKAFFSGTLRPKTSSFIESFHTLTKQNKTKKQQCMEEIVTMNLGQGYLAEMSREQAFDYISRRIESLIAPKENKRSTSGQKKKSRNLSSQPSITPEVKNKSANSFESVKHPADEMVEEHQLSFFEIREEYDEYGNEIKSEAINVAEELEYLQSQVSHKKQSKETSDDEDEPTKKTKKLNQMIQNISLEDHDSSSSPKGTEEFLMNDESNNEKEFSLKSMSDQSYQSMQLRLDELIQLEEAKEKDHAINKKSAKKLQSKGWAKGFLSSKPKQKKKKSSPSLQNSNKTGPNHSELTMRSNSKSLSSTRPSAQSSLNSTTSRKSVVIHEEMNQVQHIPKIGNRSYASERAAFSSTLQASSKKSSPNSMPQMSSSKKRNSTNSSIQSIDKGVFSGVISEHSPKQNSTSNIRPNCSYTETENTEESLPKKKLSRFAQQRLLRQQQRLQDQE